MDATTSYKVIVNYDNKELFGKTYNYEGSFTINFTIATNGGNAGGDAGHGSRVVMQLENHGGFCNNLFVKKDKEFEEIDCEAIRFAIGGDDEYSALIDILTNALSFLQSLSSSFYNEPKGETE